ncbi:MAG: sulfotransferase domain-containing protein [Bacteroidota bacterium]
MFGKKKKISNPSPDVSKLEKFGFESFGNFTEEDVFIMGYPKSGNTLLQHVIAHLVYGLRADIPKSIVNNCVTEYYNNPMYFRYDPRHFFKGHELPNERFKNVIYIVRDGRAAVRSLYYFRRNLNDQVSLQTLYENGGECFVGTWNNHVEQWTENKYGSNILMIRYEDLLSRKKEQLERICEFLSLERTSEELDQVVEATSFENMKRMEQGYSWQKAKSFKTWKASGSFVREGNKDGFKSDENVDDASLEKFTSIYHFPMFHFPFEVEKSALRKLCKMRPL